MQKKNDPLIAKALGDIKKLLNENSIKNTTVVVACSGGQDSIALLLLFSLLKKSHNLTIVLGHIHHGLRKESDNEEVFVKELAETKQIICEVRHLNLVKIPGWISIAREKRYQALNDIAKKYNTPYIFLAHTQTDNIETFFMHLIRGCGLNGLEGIRPTSFREFADQGVFTYLRPLLNITRDETLQICNLMGAEPVQDPTNTNEEHLRIRLRQQIVPLIEQENRNFGSVLDSLIEQVRDINCFLKTRKKQFRFIEVDPKEDDYGIELKKDDGYASIFYKVMPYVPDSAIEFINDLRELLATTGLDISEIKYNIYKSVYLCFLEEEKKYFNVKNSVIIYADGKNSVLEIKRLVTK
jgi:tRNA(Ile)-lysidine synthetase-like protein